jgi:alanine-glyoxylate transaminase/serine-glyoxylate transaminase/serine-pyruvate transaminase
MIYALHEALALIAEEGLDARLKRHQKNAAALTAGLEAMGMVMHAQAGHRLNSLNSVRIPVGVDDLRVRQKLLNEYSIEIGGGLGPLKGKIWRVGLMGESSSEANVLFLLYALEKILVAERCDLELGAGVNAAIKVLKTS